MNDNFIIPLSGKKIFVLIILLSKGLNKQEEN